MYTLGMLETLTCTSHVKFDPWFTEKPEMRGWIEFLSSDSNFLAPFNSLNATIGKGVYFDKLSKPGLTLF